MTIAYSFHLSSKSNAVSTSTKVGSVDKHNHRKYKSKDYDKNNIEVLIGSNSIRKDIKQIYEDEFGELVKEYNSKQSRDDRKIKDYFTKVSESRQDIAAEIIIQLADMKFWEDKDLQQRKQMTPVFEKQIRKLQELCPDFKIASAIIHYDEKSPHLHIVGVPVAKGYKQGLAKQVAKTKVFTKSTLSMLQDEMRKDAVSSMSAILDFQNISLKPKMDGRNRDYKKSELVAINQEIDAKKRILDEQEASLKSYISLKKELKDFDKIQTSSRFGKISLSADDFEELAEGYKTYIANKPKLQQLQGIEEREQKLQEKEKTIAEREKLTDIVHLQNKLNDVRSSYRELYSEHDDLKRQLNLANEFITILEKENYKLKHPEQFVEEEFKQDEFEIEDDFEDEFEL